ADATACVHQFVVAVGERLIASERVGWRERCHKITTGQPVTS
ncbi:MAG: hypothetical protein ACI9CV_000464, partial [Ilumatobacter sp.]